GRAASLRSKVADREDLQSFLGAAILRPRLVGRSPPSRGGQAGAPVLLASPAEVAERAERWREVLEVDQALVLLDGWRAREARGAAAGPWSAASLAGGDGELAACARKVKELGFLFGLAAPPGADLLDKLPELKAKVPADLLLVPSASLPLPAAAP